MKSNLIHFILLTLALVGLLHYLPWWTIFVIPCLFGFISIKKEITTLWISSLSCFLVWAGVSYFIGMKNNFILAERIGQLFGQIPAISLPFVSGFIAGIYGGVGGYLGQAIKNLISKKPIPSNLTL